MKVLVIGGTRFFGIPMVNRLLENNYDVTIASRGITSDPFKNEVTRIKMDITDDHSCYSALHGKSFDVVIDKIGYSSNEMKRVLDIIECNKFIHMSTSEVYSNWHMGIKEEEFDATKGSIIWCERKDYSYDIVKRSSERVISQCYPGIKSINVRCPIVLGKKDYTKRLLFYIDCIKNKQPIKITNPNTKMCFTDCDETGRFIADLVTKDYVGPINVCANGTITINELISIIEEHCFQKAIIRMDGRPATYNHVQSYSLDTQRAKELGFVFGDLVEWLPKLIKYLAKNDESN